MLYNYFKIAFRQLTKHKLFSVLNIFGLATSLSVCMLLIMIVADQYGYDSFHANKDQIYRVITGKSEGKIPSTQATWATTSPQLAVDLKEAYPFVKNTVRIANVGGEFLIDGAIKEFQGNGFAADEDFFKVFSFEWLEGNQQAALEEPYSIVLTKELAEQFYPESNPLGQSIELTGLGHFKITGLMDDPPIRSHIYFDYLISFSTMSAMTAKDPASAYIKLDYENTWQTLVYLLLEEQVKPAELDRALAITAADYSQRSEQYNFHFESQALMDVLPSQDLSNDIGIGTPSVVLYFLMSLGFIIILAACFNYMNLSLARSLKRAREIGIRKVIGARKKDVVLQFLGEAVLISLFSFIVALGLLELLIPAFLNIDPFISDVFYLKKSPGIYLAFLAFTLFIGLIAGIFPALNISKFQPIQAIQQLSNVKMFSRIGIRKALVTIQFTLSLIFILTVIIVQQQQQHILNADLGLNVNDMMNVWMNNEKVDLDVFSQKVKQLKGVEEVSSAQHAILLGGYATTQVQFNEQQDSMDLCLNDVSENYLEQFEIELIAGESFPEGHQQKGQFMIVNEQAVNRMGLKTPHEALGKMILSDTNAYTIVGVAKDFHHSNVWFDAIQPYALTNGPQFNSTANIHLTGLSTRETVDAIHNIWKELSPKVSISAYFTDARVYHLSKFFRMGSNIIGFIGGLTIIISCLGLLGMVIYTVEGRVKEVGIRKVLGASETSIIWQLSKGFLLLLGIAVLIAIPLAFLGANLWLQHFLLRIQLGPQIALIGIGILLFLGLLTIVSQTFVAARSNPVDTLRSE